MVQVYTELSYRRDLSWQKKDYDDPPDPEK